MTSNVAVIAGAGSGLSASLARLLAREGFQIVLAARNIEKLGALQAQAGAQAVATDVSDPASVEQLFDVADKAGPLSLVIFNASGRARGPMLALGSGSILFTGATASVKGFAGSAGFAMPKFGLRGLAQSMARELAPKNIHVAHFIIDGAIASAASGQESELQDRRLSPDAIAAAYLSIHRQHRSAWTWEMELRPWVENF
ncbi:MULTISPECIES: SDR family NAD(P)-dependent oxidoreductase [unclassified Mesorhizobium]|uniref:SDR family NAD(P)-dependent oxidoreductase n=1 Tax=unclassified Mesorhizobium TaxID=325217 RepID=UPI000FDA0F7B|nr:MULTISPECIES: SDR family NAD(P)-dependent oxidoreductase [unclassified Mesorhizobium]TGR43594.1 SDR family NAD(P)-dependent oxidoreductase [bacterium M00.F.Ca.ET.199.01.1.1]TGU39941.1 SDR family NAD(P)-dependent oxidoreductase [bacterium M00.F.Ca.ET.156.01.1.1]TGV86748.1 SDR family NAD(P)-dependent oxidoreductase [Mesorhizobium sp. M00.F.Ca.ET.149.01.1.1]TIT51927.1 MAG: SDR family NAD(P)-dependent oxidoreductase [Mesorhizobium sp.]TGR27925.1 SDR family NAD(P)-dependent oxidoreductase [Mesor